MTSENQAAQWLTVDEGWGRRAVDFAALLEPAGCREYVDHVDPVVRAAWLKVLG